MLAYTKVNYLNLPLKTFALKGKTLRNLIASLSNDAMITYAGGEGSESIMIRWYNDNKGQYEGYIITKENDKNAYVLLSEMIDDGVKKADAAREYFSLEAANDDIRFSRSASTQAKYEQAKSKGETKLNYRQWVQVRTPEFKAWFGDWENDPENASKVVNPKTGEPLVVYHGTPEGGFSEFAPTQKGKRTNHSADDVGYHFTSDPGYAEAYSEGYKLESIEEYRSMFGNEPAGIKMPPGASTYPVYLSLQNPMIVGPSRQINKALIEQAIAAGHDGIVADMGGAREYVAFHPEQIKSAIGNSGAFSAQNADFTQ